MPSVLSFNLGIRFEDKNFCCSFVKFLHVGYCVCGPNMELHLGPI